MKELGAFFKYSGKLFNRIFSAINLNNNQTKSVIGAALMLVAVFVSLAMVPTDKKPSQKSTTAESVVINTDNSDIPSNQVNSIYIDSSNVKWVGTDLGLARFNDTTWVVYTTADHLLNNNVNDIDYERTAYGKELWIATDSGLTVAAYSVDGITSATTYIDANSGLVDNKVNKVCVDTLHNRWVATDSALSVFKGNKWDSTLYGLDAGNDSFYLAEFKITDLGAFNAENHVFASTAGKGIMRYYNDEVDGITGASSYAQPWSWIESDNVQSIAIKGVLQWYGTDNGANQHTSSFAKGQWTSYNVDSGLISNNIGVIHIDKNNNVWFGTPEGLSVFTGKFWYKYTESEGLVSNQVNCITSDMDKNVWVGTSAGIEWFTEIPGVVVDTVFTDNENTVADNSSAISVFPNRVTNYFIVAANFEKAQSLKILIYSTDGRLVDIPVNDYIGAGKSYITIDVSNSQKFTSGIYIVKIKGETFEQSVKINKQ